jgi:uncharacterized protein (DUF952 family)
MIYHITTRTEWEAAQEMGRYEAASLATEGFIHLSTERQVAGVLDRYYKGVQGLVRLTVDPEKLAHELRWEMAPSVNEEFPHVYGPINLDAVTAVDPVG